MGDKPSAILTEAEDLKPFNADWLRHYEGASQVALFPSSVEQVQALLRHCHERRLAVVPQGGNTGLVGGSVPAFDEVILSTVRMNKITSFDESLSVVRCEAGVVLEALSQELEKHRHIVPLDLGAKGRWATAAACCMPRG